MTALITTVLVPPNKSTDLTPADFDDKADTFAGDLPVWTTEANALATEVNSKATAVASQSAQCAIDASDSEDSRQASEAAAALAYGYAGLPAPAGYGSIKKTEGAANYKNSAFTAAVSRTYDVDTSGGTFDITMPSSPAIGDWVAFRSYLQSYKTNRAVLKYGSVKLFGETSDKNLDVVYVELVYRDSTQGWTL